MDENQNLEKNIKLQPSNLATCQCQYCDEIMLHISTRKCKCHAKQCHRRKSRTCTIFRKLSKTNLKQDVIEKEQDYRNK